MASYRNRVYDTVDADFVEWDTSPYPDPNGDHYTGSGVYGVNTSDYVVSSIGPSPLDVKNSVRFVATSTSPGYSGGGTNVLTATSNAVFPTQDGITPALGDSLLLTDDASASSADNGIYVITTLGSGAEAWELTRRVDANTSNLVNSMMTTLVEEGTIHAPGTRFTLTTPNPIILNSTGLTFSDNIPGGLQQSYEGGNTIDVTAAEGAPSISNSTDATDTLVLSRTFAGAGAGVDINMGPGNEVVTGDGINITSGTGATGAMLKIVNEGSGAALEIEDGAGNPVVQVNDDGSIELQPTTGSGLTGSVSGAGVLTLSAEDGGILLDATSGTGGVEIYGDDNILIDTNGVVELSHVGGLTKVQGDFLVEGTTTAIKNSEILVDDNHIYLNNGYDVAAAQTGGLVVNYLPTATTDTVAATGFVAGVNAVSNPTVNTAGSGTYSAGDLIQIKGTNEPGNEGLYEVLTHVGTLLTIRGIGLTGTVEDFTQNQFVTDTTVAGTITQVNVSVLRANTAGVWEYGSGSSTGLTFVEIGALGAFSSLVQKTDADDGDPTSPGNLYVCLPSADFGLKLPDVTGLPIGTEVKFFVVTDTYRVVISGEDAGTDLIVGAGAPGESDFVIYGHADPWVFTYMGTDLGDPFWMVESQGYLPDAIQKSPVDLATTAALPAATLTGADHVEILTGDVVGVLTVDGVDVSTIGTAGVTAAWRGGILVKDESTAAKNGVWQVENPGAVGDFFVLKRRADWTFQQANLGAEIPVLSGTQNAGKTFRTTPNVSVGSHVIADFTGSTSEAVSHPTQAVFSTAGVPRAAVDDTEFVVAVDLVRFAATVATPVTFTQGDETAASTDARSMTIQAQNATGATSDGGDLILKPGTGTDLDGDLQLGLDVAQIEVDGTSIGFFEVAPVTRRDATGSRNSTDALTSIMTGLEELGLFTDSTVDYTAPLTPAQLLVASSPFENYEPIDAESWKYGEIFRLTSDGNVVIGGLASIPAAPRRIRHLVNANTIASGYTITLKHLGGGGLAGSDVLIAGAADLVLQPNAVVTVWEDFTTGKWRVM